MSIRAPGAYAFGWPEVRDSVSSRVKERTMEADVPEMAVVYQGQLMLVKEVRSQLEGAGVSARILQPGTFSNS